VKLNNVSNVPTVVGFGDTSNWNGVFPEYLLEASVPVASHQNCNDQSSFKGTIVETAMFCAGLTERGRISVVETLVVPW
jgi:Trypsin